MQGLRVVKFHHGSRGVQDLVKPNLYGPVGMLFCRIWVPQESNAYTIIMDQFRRLF